MSRESLQSELLILEREVLRAVATRQSLTDTMDLLCRRVENLLPSIACSVLAVDDGRLRPLAGPSLPTAYRRALDGYAVGPGAGSCGAAIYRRQEVEVPDIATDPLLDDVRHLILPEGLVSCRSSPILVPDGSAAGAFGFYRRSRDGDGALERMIADVSVPLCAIAIEHDRAHGHAHRLAYRDALTQLANRTAFFARARQLAARSAPGRTLAVIYLDLDGFKEINDSLGHWAGDQILMAVGKRFAAFEDDSSTVARLGGDEFALVRGDCDAAVAERLATRLLHAFDAPFTVETQSIAITASAGIAFLGPGDEDFTDLMKNADLALYRAKAEGGGRVCFFTPEMALSARRRREFESDLGRALERDEFFLVYQPIVNLASGRVTGCEALVRWRQPTAGLRMPAEFIGLAEELGLIAPIGAWVLEEACREAANWPEDIYVAVNLSAIQLRDPDFCAEIVRILERTGLAATRLQIEITESVLLAESPVMAEALTALREMGIVIALDDFGSGYSSLRSVRAFRPDKIKVDRSFVWELDQDRSKGIAGAVVALAQNLGMTTTAEGIETDEQARVLLADGCIEGQGYHFSRPLPVEEIRARMADLGFPTAARRAVG